MQMSKKGGYGGDANESRMMNGDYDRYDDDRQRQQKNVINNI